MSEAVKTFVIDTNVFIHRPEAIFSFRDNEIVIPLWVLEELDNLKKERDERGRNARETIRLLDEVSRHGDLREGVRLENGSTLRVELGRYDSPENVPANLAGSKNDNKILATAYGLQRAGRRVFFVSKDISARLKATAMGLKAVDYEKQKVNIQTLGWQSEGRYLQTDEDISSVAFWYQMEPHVKFPALPEPKGMEW